MTLISAPVLALISVTESLPLLATQTLFPSGGNHPDERAGLRAELGDPASAAIRQIARIGDPDAVPRHGDGVRSTERLAGDLDAAATPVQVNLCNRCRAFSFWISPR